MEKQTIKYVTPEQLGYKDRGILKWQGMILSDHTDALKKELSNYHEIEPKVEMSEEEISIVLHKAYKNSHPVSIQANVIQNGNYFKDVQCVVIGQIDNKLCLQLKDGRTTSCTLEEIRNVEMMDPLDWYDKRKQAPTNE